MGTEERIFGVTYGELIEMVGSQKDDKKLMDTAIKQFKKKAKKKFLNGIREHNPKGDKGMRVMTKQQKFEAIKEEIIDLWFYVISAEED
tara:strand:- start:7297 stop:7563 length:267 start_codon:yes stop_codon:yes gene_type:complete